MAKLRRTSSFGLFSAVAALGCSIVVSAQALASKAPQTNLTSPSAPTSVRVPGHASPPQLTPPARVAAVPYEISTFEYEQHMLFQRNEDALSTRIDRLSDKIDDMKATLDGDHKDIDSLKDTRTHWQAYLTAFGALWALVTGLVGYLERGNILRLFRRAEPPPSS